MTSNKSFLERLGIYGYHEAHERALLASILTGTPVLFIGHIGEAKTKAAEMFAALLGEPFQKIAADKAQFEDMVGFPNPKSLSEGKIEYATTPISIWDKRFILIDEISRCNPQMQNKFLEIVLERQLMGMATDVKWVWATMNPLEYAGSQPLDEALAGRMGYVLQIKRIIEQSNAIVAKVVSSRNYAQTPALSHWTDMSREYKPDVPQALREELQDLMYQAGKIFSGLDDHWTPVVSKYLAAFGTAMVEQNGMPLDGRRLVMIKNNIIANIAIQTVQKGTALNIQELKELCGEVIPLSIPWLATGISATFDIAKFKMAHKTASSFLESTDSLIYRIVTEQDPIRKIKLFLDNRNKIAPAEAAGLIAGVYDPPKTTGTPEENWKINARSFAMKLAFGRLALTLPKIPAEVIAMATKGYPLNFNKRLRGASDSNCARIVTESYTQTLELAEQYRKLMESKNTIDIAAAYFAFQTERGAYTYDEIQTRLEIGREALLAVRSELAKFNQEEHGSSNATSINTPNSSTDAALEEIFQATARKDAVDGSGTGDLSLQIGGAATL